MRFIRIALILTVFLLSNRPAAALTGKGLELTVSFDKNEYKQSDQIYVTFRLKNNTAKPVWVNKRFYLNSKESAKKYREVCLSVISPSGIELPCNMSLEPGLPRADYFILLKPGEEVSVDRQQNIKHCFDFSAPGTYRITAVYQNIYGKEIGLDVFMDKIESKPVTIKVLEKD